MIIKKICSIEEHPGKDKDTWKVEKCFNLSTKFCSSSEQAESLPLLPLHSHRLLLLFPRLLGTLLPRLAFRVLLKLTTLLIRFFYVLNNCQFLIFLNNDLVFWLSPRLMFLS